jgi:DNA modification methylase
LQAWPADKVERWPIDRLIPYARNARMHSDEQIAQVAASIREWGWTNPVLVGEDGGIIAGHCRVLAGRKLGLAEVPVMLASGWTEAQRRAYLLADNQLTLNGQWNPELLRLELADLQGLDFNLGLLGFDEAQLAALTTNPGLTDPDEVPEAPIAPISELGDVWQLGRHRLVCGDATNAEDVARVLAGVKPHLMVTDPPYGVGRDKGFGGSGGFGGVGAPIARRKYADAWDSERPTSLSNVVNAAEKAIIFGGNFFADILPRSTHWIVWDKQNTMPTFGDCELAWTNLDRKSVKKFVVVYNGLIGKEKERFHPTQKPVELFRLIFAEYGNGSGGSVADFYVGSGTAIIAAEMTVRACHALEINPAYVDVSIERWQNFTGEKAKRVEPV